jgi:hypothetical protein
MGAFPLLGLDSNAWEKDHEDDLIALSARNAPDTFSRWFNGRLIPWIHSLVGERIMVRSIHHNFYFACSFSDYGTRNLSILQPVTVCINIRTLAWKLLFEL